MLILDLWGISFHGVVVFGLSKNLLLKSILGRCEMVVKMDILNSFMPNFQFLTHRPPLEAALLSSKMTASKLIEFELGKCGRIRGVFRTFELRVLTVIDCPKIAGAKGR